MMTRSERRKTMIGAWIAGAGAILSTVGPLLVTAIAYGRDTAALMMVDYPIDQIGGDFGSVAMTMFVVRLIGILLAVGGVLFWGITYSKYHMRDKPPGDAAAMTEW